MYHDKYDDTSVNKSECQRDCIYFTAVHAAEFVVM